MKSPTAAEIRKARLDAGFSCRSVSRIVPWSERTQIRYEQGRTQMPPDRWVFFQMVIGSGLFVFTQESEP